MRGGLFIALVLCVAAPARAGVEISLSPAAPVKGRDTQAEVRISVSGVARAAPPVLRANVGTLDELTRVDANTFRARYLLPASRAPEVAIIVAFSPWPHPQSVEGALGVLRVPLASAVEVPGRAEAGAEVRLEIAGSTFGPVRAAGDGTFKLPVVVPPGFGEAKTLTVDRVGNKKKAKLNLMLPRVDQLACVAAPSTLPADGVSKARVLCATSDQHGGATKGAKVQWRGGRGAWSEPKDLGDGVQEWTWTAPRDPGGGEEVLRASWKQGVFDSKEELSLTLSQGPVRRIEVTPADRVVWRGGTWQVLVRAFDGLGRPLSGVTVTAPQLGSSVTGINGEAALMWTPGAEEALGARSIRFTATGPTGTEPARIEVWNEAPLPGPLPASQGEGAESLPLRSGGRSGGGPVELTARVVDLSGLPVPNQKLLVGDSSFVTGADGTVIVTGTGSVVHADWPGVTAPLTPATSPRVHAEVTVLVSEAPPVDVRVSRSGSSFTWWLEDAAGKTIDGRAVELRDARGVRRVVSAGRTSEVLHDELVTVTDVASRVSAVVEASP